MAGDAKLPSKAKARKRKKSSGGFFHDLIHNPVTKYGGRGVHDLGQVAIHAPGSVLGSVDAVVKDLYDIPRHPGRKVFPRTNKILMGSAEDFAHSFRHPLEHPGYTGLNALALIPGLEWLGMSTKAGRLARANRFKRTRVISHKSKTQAEEDAISAARGIQPGEVGRVHTIHLPAAPTLVP